MSRRPSGSADVDLQECGGDFLYWNGINGSRWHGGRPGARNDVWLLDVNGNRVAIQTSALRGTPETLVTEARGIVESTDFNP